jgi:hypothetical protein
MHADPDSHRSPRFDRYRDALGHAMIRPHLIVRLLRGSIAAAGIFLALVAESLVLNLTVLCCVALVGAPWQVLGVRPGAVPDAHALLRVVVRRTGICVMWGAAAVGAASLGIGVLLPSAVFVAVTSPGLIVRFGYDAAPDRCGATALQARRARAAGKSNQVADADRPPRSAAGPDAAGPYAAGPCAADLSSVSTRELVQTWRHSYLTLVSTSDLATRSSVVRYRQLYLDELERRDPRGVQAWLESGARAAGDPSRYLRDDEG